MADDGCELCEVGLLVVDALGLDATEERLRKAQKALHEYFESKDNFDSFCEYWTNGEFRCLTMCCGD